MQELVEINRLAIWPPSKQTFINPVIEEFTSLAEWDETSEKIYEPKPKPKTLAQQAIDERIARDREEVASGTFDENNEGHWETLAEAVDEQSDVEDEDELEEADVNFVDRMTEEVEDDEAYLGEATLAKLRSGDLDFLDDEELDEVEGEEVTEESEEK